MTLMALPREIRDCIYEFVWSGSLYLRVASHGSVDSSTAVVEPVISISRRASKKYRNVHDPVPPQQDACAGESNDFTRPIQRVGADESVGALVKANTDDRNAEMVSSTQQDLLDSRNGIQSNTGVSSTHGSLLFVNRQISAEAAPVYYKRSIYVLDLNGTQATKYLQGLSDVARTNITSLALTSKLLYDKQVPGIPAWFGDKEKPLHRKEGLTLITPFATLLAEALPRLSEVSFHVPVGGRASFYCGWATRELHMMLKHGRIQKLSHVFDGRWTASTIGEYDSQECYERLMGPLSDGRELAEHEFELENPLICITHGESTHSQRAQDWLLARENFVQKHARPFAWTWEHREAELDAQQPVQTMVTCTTTTCIEEP